MTVLHSGSNKKFSAGWDSIFSGTGGKKKSAAKTKTKVKASAQGAKKKSPGKKKSKRK